jgi:hypothetical protein
MPMLVRFLRQEPHGTGEAQDAEAYIAFSSIGIALAELLTWVSLAGCKWSIWSVVGFAEISKLYIVHSIYS